MTGGDRFVRLLVDDADILPILEPDRRGAAYALCDLDPPYRERTRFLGSSAGSAPDALVILYRLPGAHATLAFGEIAGVQGIVREYADLPSSTFLIVRREYVPAFAQRYRLGAHSTVSRMVLDASAASVSLLADPRPRRLSALDIPAVRSLYRHWGNAQFDPLMIDSGICYGVFQGTELVSVAGTHTWSPGRGIAAIGGVFTHPDHRGKGLATAATAAVVADAVDAGIDLIVLNVIADNEPAIAVYRRLGFTHHDTYVEGHAERKA